ncbi:hypothetical protein VP01_1785g2 [Puccinia sorghi]|uniref:Uncharacterized protein n=1 Tax=Puccinia sorghi TaxID=27349 RepID=A0A0L6VGF7_9BASI|nr:hypothetical protein VP01_1785g2 [Puccinia sorghi]
MMIVRVWSYQEFCRPYHITATHHLVLSFLSHCRPRSLFANTYTSTIMSFPKHDAAVVARMIAAALCQVSVLFSKCKYLCVYQGPQYIKICERGRASSRASMPRSARARTDTLKRKVVCLPGPISLPQNRKIIPISLCINLMRRDLFKSTAGGAVFLPSSFTKKKRNNTMAVGRRMVIMYLVRGLPWLLMQMRERQKALVWCCADTLVVRALPPSPIQRHEESAVSSGDPLMGALQVVTSPDHHHHHDLSTPDHLKQPETSISVHPVIISDPLELVIAGGVCPCNSPASPRTKGGDDERWEEGRKQERSEKGSSSGEEGHGSVAIDVRESGEEEGEDRCAFLEWWAPVPPGAHPGSLALSALPMLLQRLGRPRPPWRTRPDQSAPFLPPHVRRLDLGGDCLGQLDHDVDVSITLRCSHLARWSPLKSLFSHPSLFPCLVLYVHPCVGTSSLKVLLFSSCLLGPSAESIPPPGLCCGMRKNNSLHTPGSSSSGHCSATCRQTQDQNISVSRLQQLRLSNGIQSFSGVQECNERMKQMNMELIVDSMRGKCKVFNLHLQPKTKATCTHCLVRDKGAHLYLARQCGQRGPFVPSKAMCAHCLHFGSGDLRFTRIFFFVTGYQMFKGQLADCHSHSRFQSILKGKLTCEINAYHASFNIKVSHLKILPGVNKVSSGLTYIGPRLFILLSAKLLNMGSGFSISNPNIYEVCIFLQEPPGFLCKDCVSSHLFQSIIKHKLIPHYQNNCNLTWASAKNKCTDDQPVIQMYGGWIVAISIWVMKFGKEMKEWYINHQDPKMTQKMVFLIVVWLGWFVGYQARAGWVEASNMDIACGGGVIQPVNLLWFLFCNKEPSVLHKPADDGAHAQHHLISGFVKIHCLWYIFGINLPHWTTLRNSRDIQGILVMNPIERMRVSNMTKSTIIYLTGYKNSTILETLYFSLWMLYIIPPFNQKFGKKLNEETIKVTFLLFGVRVNFRITILSTSLSSSIVYILDIFGLKHVQLGKLSYTDCNEQTKSGTYAGLHAADTVISLFRAINHFHNEVTHGYTLSPINLYLFTGPRSSTARLVEALGFLNFQTNIIVYSMFVHTFQ